MKSLKKLSLLALTYALLGTAATAPAYADDAMMKKDDSSAAMSKDDDMIKKSESMKKDAMTKGDGKIVKKTESMAKDDAMSKDKMAPDAGMMNK